MIRACLWLLAGTYALQLSSFASHSGRLIVVGVALLALLAARTTHALIAFVLGVLLFVTAVQLVVAGRLDTRFAGDSVLSQVRIAGFPQQKGGTATFVAAPIADRRLPKRIRMSWFEPPVSLRLGDIWQLEMRLSRPRGKANPGGFDYEAWLTRERIGATGYVVAGKRNHLLRSGVVGVTDAVRQRFVDRLVALFPDNSAAGVLAAISVGARHLVSAEQWERYARSGTSHLMAISGLHIGLAASGAYLVASLCLGLIVRHRNVHDAATVAALCVTILYALVSGLAVPARRAMLMIALAAAVLLRRRQLSPALIVSVACIVLVVADPLATMAPGFRLSFTAVVVLIWLAHGRMDTAGKGLLMPYRVLRELTRLQVALLFGLLPFTALLFHRIALAAPAVNVLAVPVFSFLTVPLALAGLLLDGPLQTIGDMALRGAAWSVQLLELLIAKATLVPGASVEVAAIEGAAWLCLGLVMIQVVTPTGWPGRAVAWLAAAALLLHRPSGPPHGCVDLDVLDVGQGLSVIAQTHRGAVVFDTGPSFRDGSSSATTTVLPYLQHRGIERIDHLIISHADLDHAGGVTAILAELPVGVLLLGEPLPAVNATSRRCTAGQRWSLDGVRFRLIHPPGESRLTGNDASCVVVIEVGSHRAVLTGDIERPVEQDLVARRALGSADLVVVPHHGSRTSSSTAFVATLQPVIAIVAAGHDNRWGFPKPDISNRWQSVGAEVLTTSSSGAVGVRMCAEGGIVSLARHRDARRRIWHDHDL